MTDPHLKNQKQTEKKGLSAKAVVALITISLILFLVTPLPSMLVSLIPNWVAQRIIAPIYQEIILADIAFTVKEPKKYGADKPLPVISHNSGICFYLNATRSEPNKNIIDPESLDKTINRMGIAEVIAMGENKIEYPLPYAELNEFKTESGKTISILCQKFGKASSAIPKNVTAVYVRPYKPFTPHRVTWATAINTSR